MSRFRKECSPMWEAFTQVCFELNIDMADDEAVDKAWEMWFAGFTCGVVNSSSPQLGKLSDHFDPRIPRHELALWSVLPKNHKR